MNISPALVPKMRERGGRGWEGKGEERDGRKRAITKKESGGTDSERMLRILTIMTTQFCLKSSFFSVYNFCSIHTWNLIGILPLISTIKGNTILQHLGKMFLKHILLHYRDTCSPLVLWTRCLLHLFMPLICHICT